MDGKKEWMIRKLIQERTFGYDYRTVAWSGTSTKLAVLGDIYFLQLNMKETKSGDFVYLSASKVKTCVF
jgi:hypothetical protein